MRQSDEALKSNNIYWYRRYFQQMLVLAGVLLFSLASSSVFALAPNPGATCTGISGAFQGSFTNADYTNLVAANNTPNYVTVAGNSSGNIPLQVKISTTESSASTVLSNFGVINSDGNRAINIRRTFPNVSAFTEINLDFQNTNTAQPLFLSNVALSAFDIDYSSSYFDDAVKITGITQTNTEIQGTFQNIAGSNVMDNSQGLITRDINLNNCPAKNLSNACQGSIQFSEAVKSVKIRYGNYIAGNNSSPTNQEIDFRVDNYCYKPPTNYTFTGTVFNDNGGITPIPANKQNISSTFTSNQNYFNGIFDSDESGISATGLQVRLTDCNGTNIINTTAQTVSTSPIGKYTFNVPATALAGKTRVCLVEVEPDPWVYSVDTTTNSREITLVNNIYSYSNIDFGEVQSENAALVLIKSQYLYDCRIVNFNNIVNANTNPATPRQGFSTNSATDAIPGECIAYRIEAFNRGHVDIKDVQISDTLQTTSVKSTFFTAQPPYGRPENVVYTSSNPGPSNGKIMSDKFDLARVQPSSNNIDKGSFFFSTKYGNSSGSNP